MQKRLRTKLPYSGDAFNHIVSFIVLLLVSVLPTSGLTESVPDESSSLYTDSLPVYHLGEIIVVRGTRDAPPSIGTLNLMQFNTEGLTSTREALNSLPGVHATYGQKGESHLQIRGFQGREVLILVDGRPVNLPYYGDVDLNSLPLGSIAKIKVMKGSAGPLYGANTLGGIVNLITKRTHGQGTRKLRFSVGPENSYQADLDYGDRIGQVDYWLTAGRSKADGYRLASDFEPSEFEDGDRRDNTDHDAWHLDGKISREFSSGTVLSFSSGYYTAERGLPSSNEFAVYQRFIKWRRHYFDLAGEGSFNKRVSWRSKVYLTKSYNRLKRYQSADYDDSLLKFDSVHDMDELGFRSSLEWVASKRLMITTGFAANRSTIDLQPDAGAPWEFNSISIGSFYTQLELDLHRSIAMTTGVAVSTMSTGESEASNNIADPHLSFTLSPLPYITVHLAASRATRFPTLSHLYTIVSGNPDLEPERATKLEAGYRLQIKSGLSLSQTAFRSNVDDLIDRASRQDLYLNINAVTLRGVETELSYDRGDWLRMSLAHTYLDAFIDDTFFRRQHSPRNKTDYRVSVTHANFTLGHTGQYVSDRVDGNQVTMPDYFLAHAKLSYRIDRIELFVNARNLLDKVFEEERGWPMPGRMVFVGFASQY